MECTIESKLMSVCCKLVKGMYPRDDTLIEKMLSTLDSEFTNFDELFRCADFVEFVKEIHLLEWSDKHPSLSAVIRILGQLWKHQPLEVDVFKKKVSAVLKCWLLKDTKTLPKTVLYACLCCLTNIFKNGNADQWNLVNECLPFVKSCLKEDSLFVRNAAMNLLTELTFYSVSNNRQQKEISSSEQTIQNDRDSCNGISKTNSHNNTETKTLKSNFNSSHEVQWMIIECFEVYVSALQTQYYNSSTTVCLGLLRRLCHYLEKCGVYEYMVDGLQVPGTIVQLFAHLKYSDMVSSLEILSAICKYRPDEVGSSIIEKMFSVCQSLLSQGKLLETALLASWILQHFPKEKSEAGSILLATMQSCVRQDDSKTYVNKSVKTLTRCLMSVHCMHSHRQEVLQFLCGLLNPDLGLLAVTSVTETLKVQSAAIDALSLLTNDADLPELKSIIHTCVYILRTSELAYQKISKSLRCIQKAVGELGRNQQTLSRNGGQILSHSELSNLVLSLLNSRSYTRTPHLNIKEMCNNDHGVLTDPEVLLKPGDEKEEALKDGAWKEVALKDGSWKKKALKDGAWKEVALKDGSWKKKALKDGAWKEVDSESHNSRVTSREVNVVEMCLVSVKWELRDSALEFVGGLATLAKEYPGACTWLEKCEFVSLLWNGVEDTESYVRASALTALQQWLEGEVTRKLVLADLSQETIMTRVTQTAENDYDVFPRRSAVDFLTRIFQLNFWPSVYEPVLQLMYKLIQDSDWDVKIRVLKFWELFIDVHTSKLEDATAVSADAVGLVVEKKILDDHEKSEVIEEFVLKLCESRVSDVLSTGVHDCDPAVKEKAALLLRKLKVTCVEHGFYNRTETHRPEMNMDNKDGLLNREKEGGEVETVEQFLSWLHRTDKESSLTESANQGTGITGESFESLLDDILVSLGDPTGNHVTEEDNNAAAVDCY